MGLEHLDPALIDEAPGNWRVHTDEQRIALQTLLDQVGIAGAIVVYKKDDGRYQLIDGHLRHDMLEQPIPSLVLDVDDREARVLLASMDAIGELAGRDDDAFQALLEEMSTEDGLRDLVRQIEIDADSDAGDDLMEGLAGTPGQYPITPSFDEGYDAVVIFCRTTGEFAELQNVLGLEPKEKAEGGHVGLCRAITAPEFLGKWRSR